MYAIIVELYYLYTDEISVDNVLYSFITPYRV